MDVKQIFKVGRRLKALKPFRGGFQKDHVYVVDSVDIEKSEDPKESFIRVVMRDEADDGIVILSGTQKDNTFYYASKIFLTVPAHKEEKEKRETEKAHRLKAIQDVLSENPGSTTAEIAGYLGLEAGQVRPLLKLLEKDRKAHPILLPVGYKNADSPVQPNNSTAIWATYSRGQERWYLKKDLPPGTRIHPYRWEGE